VRLTVRTSGSEPLSRSKKLSCRFQSIDPSSWGNMSISLSTIPEFSNTLLVVVLVVLSALAIFRFGKRWSRLFREQGSYHRLSTVSLIVVGLLHTHKSNKNAERGFKFGRSHREPHTRDYSSSARSWFQEQRVSETGSARIGNWLLNNLSREGGDRQLQQLLVLFLV
jgi:ABC-type multidrug transport system fused ATPase/permease subunit